MSTLFETAHCNDLYAWLLERVVRLAGDDGAFGAVVPLSLTFGGAFAPPGGRCSRPGRTSTCPRSTTCLTAFSTRGRAATRLSTENMQRTTIIIGHASRAGSHVHTTDLLRWSHEDRPVLFRSLRFAETTDLATDQAFPKIGDERLVGFWQQLSASSLRMSDLAEEIYSEGRRPEPETLFLTVPRATGYFVSATPGAMAQNGVLSLSFRSQQELDLARVLLNSNVYFWYWRTFGDGFHQNVDIVGNFPVGSYPWHEVSTFAKKLDAIAPECASFKMYRGEKIPSYNFNRRMDVLLDLDEWIIARVAPTLKLPREIFAQSKSNSFLRPYAYVA